MCVVQRMSCPPDMRRNIGATLLGLEVHWVTVSDSRIMLGPRSCATEWYVRECDVQHYTACRDTLPLLLSLIATCLPGSMLFAPSS